MNLRGASARLAGLTMLLGLTLGLGLFGQGPPPVGSAVGQEAATPAPARPLPRALCIGCHSPIDGPPLSGQLTGRWLAPNITPDPVSGIGAWSRDELFAYLRHGRAPGRGQAGGPMARVVEALQDRPDEDIEALVDWLLAQPPHRDPSEDTSASQRGEPLKMDSAELQGAAFVSGEASHTGVALYNGACASCHGVDGAGSRDGRFPSLFHNSSVGRTPPHNLVAALLEGIERHLRDETVLMQSFDATKGVPGGLSDRDLAELTNFVVKQFGNPAAPATAPQDIDRARLEWWGEGEPTAARGELIAVGGAEAAGACFNCHGLQGQGDAGSGTPRLAGLEIQLFRQADARLRLGTAAERRDVRHCPEPRRSSITSRWRSTTTACRRPSP